MDEKIAEKMTTSGVKKQWVIIESYVFVCMHFVSEGLDLPTTSFNEHAYKIRSQVICPDRDFNIHLTDK